MRILQVYKDVHPGVRGGIERYIHDLSRFLSSCGHHVDVLVAGDSESAGGTPGFRVIEYPCLCRIMSNPISFRLPGILRRAQADVVHFHVPLPSAAVSWLISGRSTPYIVTYHSDIVRQAFLLPLYGPLLRRFLRGASRVLATSPAYVETSRFLSGLDNTAIVPIGSDLGLFRPPDEPTEGDYALFVGRFRAYKGIKVLLEAWRSFPERKLLMVGGGPLEGFVRESIGKYGLNIEIVSDPDDNELVRIYQNAKCLVLPSTKRSEAFGMVQTEAMACGVPVISTDLPTGVPWVNMDGVSGMVIPPSDAEALANALRDLDDHELRSRLAAGALDRAGSLFEADVLFRRVEELLLEAADAPG